MKSFTLLVLLLGVPALLCGREPADLGQGLSYIRIESLPIALPTSPTLKAVVLDLRYATGDETAAAALTVWLQTRVGAPTFVLANPETAAPVRQALLADRLPAGTLTVGRAGDMFAPDIAIAVTADADQAAWAALTTDADPSALVTDNLGKVRNDEAAIVRRHQNGQTNEPDEAESDISSLAPAPVPTDRVLQRAVQLHRGLIALGAITH